MMSEELTTTAAGSSLIMLSAVPPQPANAIVPLLIGTPLCEVERELILQTLARCNGNRTHAARLLDMPVRTLRNKIKVYLAEGLEVPAHGT